jgi:hypothetical protein
MNLEQFLNSLETGQCGLISYRRNNDSEDGTKNFSIELAEKIIPPTSNNSNAMNAISLLTVGDKRFSSRGHRRAWPPVSPKFLLHLGVKQDEIDAMDIGDVTELFIKSPKAINNQYLRLKITELLDSQLETHFANFKNGQKQIAYMRANLDKMAKKMGGKDSDFFMSLNETTGALENVFSLTDVVAVPELEQDTSSVHTWAERYVEESNMNYNKPKAEVIETVKAEEEPFL